MLGFILLLSALYGPLPTPLRYAPEYQPAITTVSLPPSFEDRLLYYQSFDTVDAAPEVNRTGVTAPVLTTGTNGFYGRGSAGQPGEALHLVSETFSPHQPLTVAFWWALTEDAKIDGSFGLFHLTNGSGFVSHFSRGRGEWCALQRPAAVLQIYYLPQIQNVNGIYDYDLLTTLDLRAFTWHHTALVINGASLVRVYTDGRLAWETRTQGRNFMAHDRLHDLTIGSSHGTPLALDEVLILRRALTDREIAEYVRAIAQMHEAKYPLR
ncbi:MAG: LamG-like jellyroll fold domain-containing protein [Candidatus Zipacnadales bacterium]